MKPYLRFPRKTYLKLYLLGLSLQFYKYSHLCVLHLCIFACKIKTEFLKKRTRDIHHIYVTASSILPEENYHTAKTYVQPYLLRLGDLTVDILLHSLHLHGTIHHKHDGTATLVMVGYQQSTPLTLLTVLLLYTIRPVEK